MRVTFVLPGPCQIAGGGSRVVLRYANAIAAAGWRPSVVMVPGLRPLSPMLSMARICRYVALRYTRGYRSDRWQTVAPGVRLLWLPDLRRGRAPLGDVVIATSVQTAEAIAAWPRSSGRKFYFVQGYETWDFPAERVQASWRLPFVKLAVSRWLCELITAVGEAAEHLPNGVDEMAFGLDRAVESRCDPVVLWPHHAAPQKGSPDVLRMLEDLAAEVKGLRVHAFGVSAAPRPAGVRVCYHRNPSPAALRALYNGATVAIAPSYSEGWGLPACEALQCGCALAASDIGGHREFLRHDRNALLHQPGDLRTLRENTLRLLRDEPLRWRLAKQGLADMKELRFDAAVDRLKRVLLEEAIA